MISEERIVEYARKFRSLRVYEDAIFFIRLACQEATEEQIRRDAKICDYASSGLPPGYYTTSEDCKNLILAQLSPATPEAESAHQVIE